MNIKNKTIISLAIFIILSLCLIVFAIWPFFRDIKNNSTEIISQKQNIASLVSKKENLESFKNRYLEVGQNLEKMNTLFVNAEVPIDFINFLERISQECGVYLQISAGAISPPLEYNWPFFNCQLISASTFSNFSKFLEKLENNGYLIEVQNINITRLSPGEIASYQKEGKIIPAGSIKASFSIGALAK